MHVFTFVLLVYTVDLLVSIGEPTQTEMANTREGKCVYMEDLMALDTFRPTESPPIDLSLVSSSPPLPFGTWRGYMVNHPDSRFAEYILHGLSEGFQIGFDHTHRTRPSNRNMKLAGVNKLVVSGYIAEEMQRRRLLRFPVSSPWSECVHLSPFGVMLKKGQGWQQTEA